MIYLRDIIKIVCKRDCNYMKCCIMISLRQYIEKIYNILESCEKLLRIIILYIDIDEENDYGILEL